MTPNTIWILLATAVLLAVFMAFPILIKSKANSILNAWSGYSGRIAHLRLQLFRSKLVLRDIRIKSDAAMENDSILLEIPVVVIQFKWRSLLKKIIDLDMRIEKPCLQLPSTQAFVKQGEKQDVLSTPIDLKAAIEKLIAFKVNMQLVDGSVCLGSDSGPFESELEVNRINLEIHGFSNRIILSELCRISCTAQLQEGTADFSMSLRPLAPELTLGFSLLLKSIKLALFNDLLKTYAKVDLQTGRLDLSSEVIIATNQFDGYIQISIDDLDFVGAEDRDDTILSKIWERIVGGVYRLLAQNKNNRLTLLIPISGSLNDPDKSVTASIARMVRKALIRELMPSIPDVGSLWNRTKSGARGLLRRLSR